MGVRERKEREKKEMRERILQSAHDLFLRKSFEEVSIRNIADAIEYSPTSIYLYFKDKDAIFYALQGEAFKIFNLYIANVSVIKKPFNRLIRLTEKYIEFTFAHPKYYNIMFIMESPPNGVENSQNWQDGAHTHRYLESIIEECKQEGHFKNIETMVLSFTIWSYLHGMCSLVLRNRMRVYSPEHRESIRNESFRHFVSFLHSL